MRLIALSLCMLLGSSCIATSADLYDLAERIEAREAGLITDAQLADALRAKGEEIEARAVAVAGSLPSTPLGWLQLLGTAGATALAGGVGVNAHRNKKRRKNSEPV